MSSRMSDTPTAPHHRRQYSRSSADRCTATTFLASSRSLCRPARCHHRSLVTMTSSGVGTATVRPRTATGRRRANLSGSWGSLVRSNNSTVKAESRARATSRRLPVTVSKAILVSSSNSRPIRAASASTGTSFSRRTRPALERSREAKALAQHAQDFPGIRIRMFVLNAGRHDPTGSIEKAEAFPQFVFGWNRARAVDRLAVEVAHLDRRLHHRYFISIIESSGGIVI